MVMGMGMGVGVGWDRDLLQVGLKSSVALFDGDVAIQEEVIQDVAMQDAAKDLNCPNGTAVTR